MVEVDKTGVADTCSTELQPATNIKETINMAAL
jgi:hypothetical protein